jgi:hypothetical protein
MTIRWRPEAIGTSGGELRFRAEAKRDRSTGAVCGMRSSLLWRRGRFEAFAKRKARAGMSQITLTAEPERG